VSLSDSGAAAVVRWALVGAAKRLARAECQAVYSDFHDLAGRPLHERLAELGETEPGYLRIVLFRDGSSHKRCASSGITAFTAPGYRVVYICERQFERLWRNSTRLAEAVLIHEALHTLGLGENPPSSLEITRQVLRRCAR
jgi:hypothetical protein